jgi:hypothetical protein
VLTDAAFVKQLFDLVFEDFFFAELSTLMQLVSFEAGDDLKLKVKYESRAKSILSQKSVEVSEGLSQVEAFRYVCSCLSETVNRGK